MLAPRCVSSPASTCSTRASEHALRDHAPVGDEGVDPTLSTRWMARERFAYQPRAERDVVVEIGDSGPGMPPAVATRVRDDLRDQGGRQVHRSRPGHSTAHRRGRYPTAGRHLTLRHVSSGSAVDEGPAAKRLRLRGQHPVGSISHVNLSNLSWLTEVHVYMQGVLPGGRQERAAHIHRHRRSGSGYGRPPLGWHWRERRPPRTARPRSSDAA
jgi:hypothetical protein